MKRLLTILFVCSFAAASFAQRVTTIVLSVNSDTNETVTISSVSWSTDNGTITLSAAVPGAVLIGDIIIDSATNSYWITALPGGNDIDCQDFDSATDPATGSATISDAYSLPSECEADWDVTTLFASGDNAICELYNNGAFDEAVTMNGGGTVGLTSAKMTVPTAERGDGTAGTGTRFVMTTASSDSTLMA